MPVPDELVALIAGLDQDARRMPATVVYNEGWMLRLLLAAAEVQAIGPIQRIAPPAQWFSEGQLPTPFGRQRGAYSESNTNADGVVGHFTIADRTRAGLQISADAIRFEVFEAKMFAKLSRGIRGAENYDQVARTIACMAHALRLANRLPNDVKALAFYVVAPEEQIEARRFTQFLDPDHIRQRISDRIAQFPGPANADLNEWYDNWVCPLVQVLSARQSLVTLSWEDLLEAANLPFLRDFYNLCLKFNERVVAPAAVGHPHLIPGQVCLLQNEPVRILNVGQCSCTVYWLNDLARPPHNVPSNAMVAMEGAGAPELLDVVPNAEYLWNQHNGQPPVVVTTVRCGPVRARVQVEGQPGTTLVPVYQLEQQP